MTLKITPQLSHFEFPNPSIQDVAAFYHLEGLTVPEDRPYIWSNSVISLDGCLSFLEEGDTDACGISMRHYYPDISKVDFKLLHAGWAFADAIIASGAELRNEPHVKFNLLFDDLIDYRVNVLRKPEHPVLFILTGSGSIPLSHQIFQERLNRIVIVTTTFGKRNIESAMSDPSIMNSTTFVKPEILSFDNKSDTKKVDYQAMFRYMRKEMGLEFIDCTCGGNVIKQLIWEKLLDEVRLTYAGQIVGLLNSAGSTRPSLFPASQNGSDKEEEQCFKKETAPHFLYKGVRLCGERLLLIRSEVEYRH